MKKTARILSIAAFVAMGIMGAACSKIETPETQKENIVTLTTTVGFTADGTKALTGSGVKTFADGETMAVIYNNGTSTVKAVSHALEVSDITDGGKKATFTFDLETPNKSENVTYIYPAAMANDNGTVNYAALNSQDGTLTSLAANLDYCTKSGAWDGENLPTLTLENQLAILAITLKNADGSSDITGTITGMTLSDGEQSCTVTRSAAAGPIYVAIPPISNKDIEITATAGAKAYIKSLTGKTYAANNGYNVSWRMETNLTAVSGACTINNGETLTGTLGGNYKISIADGATVVLKDANISYSGKGADYAGLTLLGDGTLVLADGTNNTAIGGLDGDGYSNWPGIYVPVGKTLTINGNTGVLNAARGHLATDDGSPAGIGAAWGSNCGNIVINGGVINATGGNKGAGIGGCGRRGCGNITINGGTVTAISGELAAGIGLGGTNNSSYADGGTCGDITISGGIIIATGGEWGAGIGTGFSANTKNVTVTKTCGNILISGGTITATGGNDAAGIGTGKTNTNGIINIGTITITNGVTLVTATKGTGAPNSIGKGSGTTITCGTVTIGGTEYWDGSAYKNGGDTYLPTSPLVFPAP